MKKCRVCLSVLLLASGTSICQEPDPVASVQLPVGCSEQVGIHPFSSSKELHDFLSSFEEKHMEQTPPDFRLHMLFRQMREDLIYSDAHPERVSELSHFLKSVENYITFQEAVLETVVKTLHLLEMSRPAHVALASQVYEEVASFLRKHSSYDDFSSYEASIGNENGSSYDVQGCVLWFFRNYQTKDVNIWKNHALLISLTKKLRRLVNIGVRDLASESRWGLDLTEVSDQDLNRAIEYLSMHWIHGTRAYTLKSAQCHFEGELLSSGELKQRDVPVLSGARDGGSQATGVNKLCLSGTGIDRIQSVKRYASMPSIHIEQQVGVLYWFLDKDYSHWQDLQERDGRESRCVDAVRNVQKYFPEIFEQEKERIRQKLVEIYDLIEQTFDERPKSIFDHWDTYYSSKFYSAIKAFQRLEAYLLDPISEKSEISEEDQSLLSIGVVVGSMSRYGIPNMPFDYNNREDLISGGLKLGDDLQVVFVEDQHFDQVQELVNQLGLADSLKVETWTMLDLVDQLHRHFSVSIQDVYGLHDWHWSALISWFAEKT